VSGRQIFRSCRRSVVQIIHHVENGRVTNTRPARCWSLCLVEYRMGKITASRRGSDHGPGTISFCENIGELHRSGPVLHMKFDLCLGMIAFQLDLLHFGVEGLET
jgi:hypothetical protein